MAKMAQVAQKLRTGENMTKEQIFDKIILEKMKNISILSSTASLKQISFKENY